MTRFLFLVFIASCLLPVSSHAQEVPVEELSKKQVQQYLGNIQEKENLDLNVWALYEITRHKELLQYADSLIQESQNYAHSVLEIFQDTSLSHKNRLKKLSFTVNSPFLLVAYLLEEPNSDKQRRTADRFFTNNAFSSSDPINFKKLAQAIISGDSITTDILPANNFYPAHFLLFYDKSIVRKGLFSDEYFNTATTWSFTSNETLDKILGIYSLFRVHYLRYEYAKTESLYQPMIGNTTFPNSDRKISILRALDYSMYTLGYYNRSINITRNYSLPLAQYLNQKELALKLRIDLGSTLFYIGQIEDSKEIYLSILSEPLLESIPVSFARVFNNLAVNYWKSGEFDQFLNYQFQALNESKKEQNYSLELDALKNLFVHYSTNKDFTSAKQYLQQAQNLASHEENKKDLAQLTYYEGQLFREAESKYDQAIASFNKALDLISPTNFYRSYQDILTEKGLLLEAQGKHIEAKHIYDQMLNYARDRKDPRNILFAAFSKANTYLSLGRIDSAEVILDTLDTQNLGELDFYQLVKARTVQARYQTTIGNRKKGAEILDPVIDQIVQRSRGSGDLETGFWQVEPEYLDAFERYANLLIQTDQSEKAVEVLDRLKTINDAALYQNPLVRSKVLNEKELSEYKRITEELDVLRRQLLAAQEENQNQIQQKIDELSAQKSTLDNKITTNANPEPVTVNEVQRQLDAHQRVLHITELNDTFYFAVIGRTSVQFNKIPITEELRAGFENSVMQMANGTVDMNQLYTITKLLNITDLPGTVNKLTIIPDSYLYQLPLDVLPLQPPANSYSYGDSKYLIERFETNYMTSLNDFNTTSRSSSLQFGYAGYGISDFGGDRSSRLVPLPEAKTEIETISNQLTSFSDKKTFLNGAATEQAFRETAPNARILHLATHSEVSNQDPMFSSIYLSQSDTAKDQTQFPGRIFAYELFELHLSNELIMLNSCESGSGSYIQGTGIVGLSRALRYAGAQSLVLNLWSVNDMMASDFAIKFYEGINKGQSKSEALRNAKLHFLKTKNANPHYWGSYMLLGNSQPIIKPHRQLNNIVASSFMLFFFSIVVASSIVEIRRRNRRKNKQ